jgi:isoquinoline 1-oxidoreductase beta subunit
MNMIHFQPTRRRFITAAASAAGGLALGFFYPGRSHAAGIAASPWGADTPAGPQEINAWIVIDPDNSVLIRFARAEMGQGSFTALPKIVAEELECDWSLVKTEYASPHRQHLENKVYGDMLTAASRSVRMSRIYLQQAGASARERLIAAAAARWQVKSSECEARNSKVIHKQSGKTFDYGSLAHEASLIKLDAEPKIKSPDQFKLVGKSTARLDVPLKVTGQAKYGIDIRIPDMLYAAIAACPVFGGSVKGYDDSTIKSRRGIHSVVYLGTAVAVVADSFWRAKEALSVLPIEWDVGANGATSSVQFDEQFRQALQGDLVSAEKHGDARAAFDQAVKKADATYEVPYLAHAPMEPLNCVAHVQANRIDVWLGTQDPYGMIGQASKLTGIAPENIYVHNCFLGGGFGRRSQSDEMLQAVSVSKAVGRPVKLVYTREEDTRQGRFRPQAAIQMKGGLGSDGLPSTWEARTAVPSLWRSLGVPARAATGVENHAVDGLIELPYNIPNRAVGCVLKNTHVPVMCWRGVGLTQNLFAVESFIDELAHLAGQDPYKYRRALLIDRPEYVRILDLVAQRSNWDKPLAKGKGRGIAIWMAYDTIIAEVAEVSVDGKGELSVDKIFVVADCGQIVDPQNSALQMESGIIYGLTAALTGKITIVNGAVEQGNFNDYEMIRMEDAPKIDVHLSPRGGEKWGGMAQSSTVLVAPAICNAIFSAVGKRVRRLPISETSLA